MLLYLVTLKAVFRGERKKRFLVIPARKTKSNIIPNRAVSVKQEKANKPINEIQMIKLSDGTQPMFSF